jgi:hypothetical protein
MPTEEETIVLEPGDYELVEEEEEITQVYFSEEEDTAVYFPKNIHELVELIDSYPGV